MGEQRHVFDLAELGYVENTADFSLFEPVVNELAKDFLAVRVSRRWAGPMATPLFGDVAIAVAVGAAAGSFFGELGKDVYRALRKGLFALYKTAKTWANGRGYAPLAMIRDPESTESGPGFRFIFPPGLEPYQFEQAVRSIPEVIADYAGPATRLVGFVYDTELGWQVHSDSH